MNARLTRSEKDALVKGTIYKYLGIKGWKKKDLARVTCIPQATLYKAINDLSYMRLYQLSIIYDALGVPLDEREGL